MAEFLIMRRVHAWEKLSDAERDEMATKDKYFWRKYNIRTQPGDIIQVNDDSDWNGYDAESDPGIWYYIKVPTLNWKNYKHLSNPQKVDYTIQERETEALRLLDIAVQSSIKTGTSINQAEVLQHYNEKLTNKGKFVAKRRYRVDLTKFPQLQTNPVITVSRNEFLNALVDKNGS
jgi:hypothetical protein